MTDIEEPHEDQKEHESLERAEQEATSAADTVTDAIEDAAQPKPLNAIAQAPS